VKFFKNLVCCFVGWVVVWGGRLVVRGRGLGRNLGRGGGEWALVG